MLSRTVTSIYISSGIKASYAFQHSNFDTHKSVLDQLKSMISDIFVLLVNVNQPYAPHKFSPKKFLSMDKQNKHFSSQIFLHIKKCFKPYRNNQTKYITGMP